jgi:hypothetical protein
VLELNLREETRTRKKRKIEEKVKYHNYFFFHALVFYLSINLNIIIIQMNLYDVLMKEKRTKFAFLANMINKNDGIHFDVNSTSISRLLLQQQHKYQEIHTRFCFDCRTRQFMSV